MLEIEFKLDKNILARAMISKSAMPKHFADYLFDKYRPSYILLQKNLIEKQIDENILLEVRQQKFFDEYIIEAKSNLVRIRKNWQKNKDEINMFINKIIKKSFILRTTAFILSPKLNRGINIGNNQFVWGHEKGLTDKNYDLVYLVHESLHSYFKHNEITHAIIENIADTELAKLLNNSENGYVGHDNIKNLHIKILPFWNIYLNKPQERIEKENKINNISYNLNDFYIYESQIKNMNIDDFIVFLESLDLNKLIDLKTTYTINFRKT